MTWNLLCSTLLDALPPQKHVKELSSRITTNYFLIATFTWSRLVYQQLKHLTQKVQQYKDLITEFEETKHIYYSISEMFINWTILIKAVLRSPADGTSLQM